MCGVSGVELAVILVIALIVLGPERLPGVLRNIGKMTKELRKVTSEIADVGNDIRAAVPTQDLKDVAKDAVKRELSGDRARKRDAQVESEIDAIRARKARLAAVQSEATPVQEDEGAQLGCDEEHADASSAQTSAGPAAASAERESSDELPLPEGVRLRPASKSVEFSKISDLASVPEPPTTHSGSSEEEN